MTRVQGDITCRELVELVTDYLEGTLDRSDRTRFERHIAECPGCDEYVEQMRQTIAGLGQLDERALSPSAREELLRAFRDWRRERATSESSNSGYDSSVSR